MLPVIYELEPIGINGALEAVHVRRFCSRDCRDILVQKYDEFPGMPKYALGEESEPGVQDECCENEDCGATL